MRFLALLAGVGSLALAAPARACDPWVQMGRFYAPPVYVAPVYVYPYPVYVQPYPRVYAYPRPAYGYRAGWYGARYPRHFHGYGYHPRPGHGQR